MRIVVLGGAGKMGCISVQDLANHPRVNEVVIADQDLTQARTVADIVGSPKVAVQQLDATSHDELVDVLRTADACLNATVYYFNLAVMEACVEARVPYTDMGGLFHTTRKQLELHDRFAEAVRRRARARLDRILGAHQPEPLDETVQAELLAILDAAAQELGA